MSASSDSFDVSQLVHLARLDLVDVLTSMTGIKDLFIDEELMTPLNHIAGAGFIKEQGVEKMFKLEGVNPAQASNNRIYLARAEINRCKTLAHHIRSNLKIRKWMVVFVPRITFACEAFLEEEGLRGHMDVKEWHLDLVPIDDDLLSLELNSFYNRVFVNKDQTWLHDIAFSLIKIQQLSGSIPTVYGIGGMSRKVDEMVKFMTEGQSMISSQEGRFDAAILVDRTCDLVTPLCSQVVYQGVVDDVFTVKSGFVEFNDKLITGKDGVVKLLMNATTDPLFEEIRDQHFSSVSTHLGQKVRSLQTSYSRGKGAESIELMRSFVNELGGLKKQHRSLALHIGACEAISQRKAAENFESILATEHALVENVDERRCVEHIEDLIHRQVSALTELRLICLYSQTESGLKPRVLDSLQRMFLQSHGYEHATTFYNLKKAGLLLESSASKTLSYSALRKKLHLVPKLTEHYDLSQPTDMAYVFSGAYTPICCRLIESVLRHSGWLGLEDVTKYLPGGVIARAQYDGNARSRQRSSTTALASVGFKSVLVFFVGGCTYSEVSALRFLGSQMKIKFVIATTNMIRAGSLVAAEFR